MDDPRPGVDTRRAMRLRILALCAPLLCLLWPSCSATPATPGKPARSRADQWADLMVDAIGPGYESLLAEAERAPRDLDLAKLAGDARALAAQFALGHGRLELAEIPGFADHARGAEAWMLDIAMAAEAGDSAKVRKLVPLEAENCDACHTAAARK